MSSLVYKTPNITGIPHEPDILCEYDMCFLQCQEDLIKELVKQGGVSFMAESRNTYENLHDDFLQGTQEETFQQFEKNFKLKPNESFNTTSYLVGVAENPNFHETDLNLLHEKIKNDGDRYSNILLRLAKTPNIGNKLLETFVKHSNPLIVEIIAKRYDLSEECQKLLTQTDNPSIRMAILSNPHIKDEYKTLVALKKNTRYW